MKCNYEANRYKQLLHGKHEYRCGAYSRYRKRSRVSDLLHMLRNNIHTMHTSHTTHRRKQMSWVWKHVTQNIKTIRWLFEQIEIIRIDKNIYIYVYIYIYRYMCPSIILFIYTWITICLHRYTCGYMIRSLSVCSYIYPAGAMQY